MSSYPPAMQDAIERYTIVKKDYLNHYSEDQELMFNAMLLESSRRKGNALQAAHRMISVLALLCLGLCFYIIWKGF